LLIQRFDPSFKGIKISLFSLDLRLGYMIHHGYRSRVSDLTLVSAFSFGLEFGSFVNDRNRGWVV
ncbi:unnamed protein product, partial [Brassica oleracea]